MQESEISEIYACLSGTRTVFHYHPDRYAVYLLQRHVDKYQQQTIKDLKQSSVGKLLDRPLIKQFLANHGHNMVSAQDLQCIWSPDYEPFVLTLGSWGYRDTYSWAQTSRPGANLVLQINLASHWDALLRKLLRQDLNTLLGWSHPISETRSTTLGWVRFDLEWQSGEVLIEEIQTDLIRSLMLLNKRAVRLKEKNHKDIYFHGLKLDIEEAIAVTENVVNQFGRQWHDILLAAALWFAFEELGMDKVFYHSFETSVVLKKLKRSQPPRSLYTQLPKKFCFQTTSLGPRFITNNKHANRRLKKVKQHSWFFMAA